MSGNRTYTLSYTPAGTIQWAVSSNLRIVSGQGTPSVTIQSNGEGYGNISVTMTHTYAGKTVPVTKQKEVLIANVPDPNQISVTIGGQSSNYTLFVYHSGRNDCRANYRGTGGNNSILEYEWEANGFEVFGAGCKAGMVCKTDVGIDPVCCEIGQNTCNPVLQAEVLNHEGTELNIVVGLCVGHDSLFYRHSDAPVTTLVAKDRVLANNPAGALYTANTYYSRLEDIGGK